MPEEQADDSWKKWRWVLPIFASIQFIVNIVALAEPTYIVGNITLADAETYAQDASDLANLTISKDYVQTQIGLFRSFINGSLDGSNREGLVAVFGFALLSTISAGFALYYAIQLISSEPCKEKCSCCCSEKCAEDCRKISRNIAKFAKANFSAGVSDTAIVGMIPFTASDITGNYFGASFYLTVVGAVVSFFNNYAKEMVKAKKEKMKTEAERNPNEPTAYSSNAV